MRDIKFRAWRDSNKTMMPNNVLGYLLLLASSAGAPVNISDVTWMQFTGLQDKNGVDIYEGDILKQSYKDGDVFGVVKYVPAEGGYITEGINDILSYPLCFNRYYAGESKVIGNIHENPELLKGTK